MGVYLVPADQRNKKIDAAEKLTNLLTDETHLREVKDKVETLVMRFYQIAAVVKDGYAYYAEQGENNEYNEWLSGLRDMGNKALELIETYINDSISPGVLSLNAIRLHRLNKGVDKIQSILENLINVHDRLNFARHYVKRDEATKRRQLKWRDPSSKRREDGYIDVAEDAKVLTAQLSSMDPRYSVVSIVGMAGLGKTTLAIQLYNDGKLQFDCSAFILVSKEYNRKDILYEILACVRGEQPDVSEQKEEMDLIIKLRNFLDKKRYLVVLDDLWGKADWDNLKDAFPSGMMGSKVMLTTRNREVAKHAGCINPHKLRLLTKDESLELLLKKAFPQDAHFVLQHGVEELGRELVNECGGLPLAVVAHGGILYRKRTEEWERLSGNVQRCIMEYDNHVSQSLALSYNDLPLCLKLCFQHLALFPDDFCITKNELIRLWAAEKFMENLETREEAEERPECCIYDLINWSWFRW